MNGACQTAAIFSAARWNRAMSRWLVGGGVALLATLARGATAAATLPAEQIEFFESKIRPIFAEACYKCHSSEAGKSKGDLLLDTRDGVRKGGATGAAIVPGDPEKSLLIEAVRYRHEDLQMPPPDDGGRLSDDKVALLEEWVKMGAPDPRIGGKPHPMDLTAARRHWAFQAVTSPRVPAVKGLDRVATPVDAFVLQKLEEKQLTLSPPADSRTLLRRITNDLTGLPPTPEEMEAFLQDRAPEAYARVVERLLASPRYGERWGRFWLDVARYADTKGYLVGDAERRFAFSHTYRDYVIRAFNEDKPFDRFVLEQIAADRLALGDDKSPLAALGFLTLGRRFLNNQNDIIDDRIDVVTRGLVGLTVSCARCHDHKFDPIPTKDYYALHGVFASSEEPAEKPLLGPLVDSAAYREFQRKEAELQAKVKAREAEEVQKFLAGVRRQTGDYLLAAHDAAKIAEGEKLDVFAGARKLNVDILRRWQTFLCEQSTVHNPVLAPWRQLAALAAEDFAAQACTLIDGWRMRPDLAQPMNPAVLTALARQAPGSLADVASAYNSVVTEVEIEPTASPAVAEKAKAPVAPVPVSPAHAELREFLYAADAPANLGFAQVAEMIRREINNKTAGLKREIEALNWTEPGAPARAMALVDKATPENSKVFLRGNPANRGPEVPRQFLEIIAGEKQVPFTHGSGRLELAQHIADPKNPLTARVWVNRVWGWHFGAGLVATPSDFGVRTEEPVHRELLNWLAASFVDGGWSVKQLHRAIVLSSTYRQSSTSRPSAVAIDPDNRLVHRFAVRRLEFEALRDTLLAVAGQLELKPGGLGDDLLQEPFARRRTVYGFIDRQNLPGMFRTFDYPNPDVSSAQRFATTVPQQALFMMNSPFVLEQARSLIERPEIAAAVTTPEKIEALYRVAFQRRPDAAELRELEEFLQLAPAGEPVARRASGWHYGYGAFDTEKKRTRDFQSLVRRGDEWLSREETETLPTSGLGKLGLTAGGGHPGATAERASIRRWVSPIAGAVRIEGILSHANPAGDGVRGLIVSSARGKLGEWDVHHRQQMTELASVRVAVGDTLDFIVEPKANDTSDAYDWAPTIAYTGGKATSVRVWHARHDFNAKPRERLTRWEELAQVLLLSNELAFVD